MMREVQPISRREEGPWVPKGVQRTHGVIRGDMSLFRRPGHLSHPRTEATPGDTAANVQAETAGGTLRRPWWEGGRRKATMRKNFHLPQRLLPEH